MNLSHEELRALAEKHGFPDPDTAAAVAMAESGGKTDAEGDLTLGVSRGLWQINLKAHPEYSAVDLFDPHVNAQAAFAVSRGGASWRPWSTFNSGAYRRFMPAQTSTDPVDLFVIALIVAGVAYAKRRKLPIPT